MFFLLVNVIHQFHYLKTGLAVLLTFIGVKMLAAHWLKAIGFDTCMDFLHQYFESLPYNLTYNNSEQFNRWISKDHRIEIIVINMHMMYNGSLGSVHYDFIGIDNHNRFMCDFTNLTLKNNSKLK